MCLLGKGHAGLALDLKFLTLDLCRIIRRKVDSCWWPLHIKFLLWFGAGDGIIGMLIFVL